MICERCKTEFFEKDCPNCGLVNGKLVKDKVVTCSNCYTEFSGIRCPRCNKLVAAC